MQKYFISEQDEGDILVEEPKAKKPRTNNTDNSTVLGTLNGR